jgi:hypothetical protein
MMTFSLRPTRRSTAPETAASASLRGVFWNEIAERKDARVSETSVIPRRSCFAFCRLFALRFFHFVVDAFEFEVRDDVAGGDARVAGLGDRDAAEHLLDDDFEVLARRRYALQFVDARDFGDDVFLRALFAGKRKSSSSRQSRR